MNKGEGKRKGTTKKKTKTSKKRSDTLSTSVSKEIVGLAMIGIGLLIIIGIFSTKSGLFGQFLRSVFVGLFGVGGYILPIGAMVLGIFYMQGRFDRLFRLLAYGGSLVLMLMVFAHLLNYGDDTSISLGSLTYIEIASWQNGGYIGALIGYCLLKLVGIYGSYILLAVLYGIWMLLVTQFPIFSWLHEKLEEGMDQLKLQIEETRRMKHLVGEKSVKKTKAQKVEFKQLEDFQEKSMFVEEAIQEDRGNETQEAAVSIPFFDGADYQEERTVHEVTDEVANDTEYTITHTEIPSSKKISHEEVVQSVPKIVDPSQEEVPLYHFPPVSLLKKVVAQQDKEASKKSLTNARKLEETLASFGVEAKVTQIHRGPSVTRYELQPKQGVKVSKIVNLSDDIALNLAAPNIRIEAPIPGKAAVGIEVANATSEIVYLRDVIDSDRFLAFPSKLAFALGKDIAGKPIIADIGKMPHMLIAGATGSGKSVCINTLITSIIYKATPQEVRLIMIDPKVVELSVYNGIPHLLIPVVTDPKKAAGALFWAVNEMTRRYNLFAENNVRDMKGYNEKQVDEHQRLPQIVIIIDELADLMMTGAKEVEDAICRLAQMARAAGIHLVIATQRPSVDVITGVIKANIPSRLAFAVSSGTDSRTILDMVGAEKLLGKGDMLFYPVGESKPIRIQGAFISDHEVESIVNTIKTDRTDYEQSVMESMENAASPVQMDADDEADELLEKAVEFAADKEKLSISMLQRYFRIGFNRAARLMDALEARGIVGPDEGSKPRKVL
ncbi:MAG: DNA translocase FtsK [Cellulosilyticum sp.]|nr:DNA translocase FtsK [Cellulosilyticum sp.]